MQPCSGTPTRAKFNFRGLLFLRVAQVCLMSLEKDRPGREGAVKRGLWLGQAQNDERRGMLPEPRRAAFVGKVGGVLWCEL